MALSLDRCYADGVYDSASDFCAGILRWTGGPTVGAIQYSNVFQQNLSTIDTSGVDVQASYAWDLPGTAGQIDFTLTYGHLLGYEILPFEGADVVVYENTLGLFEHEALLGIMYSRPNMTIAWTTQYMNSAFVEEATAYWGEQEIGSQMFHDLQARFMFGDMTTVVMGVDNLTDEYVETGFGVSASTGHNTFPDVYDALGRRYYLGLRVDF